MPREGRVRLGLRNDELAVAVTQRFLVFVKALAQTAHVLGVRSLHLLVRRLSPRGAGRLEGLAEDHVDRNALRDEPEGALVERHGHAEALAQGPEKAARVEGVLPRGDV